MFWLWWKIFCVFAAVDISTFCCDLILQTCVFLKTFSHHTMIVCSFHKSHPDMHIWHIHLILIYIYFFCFDRVWEWNNFSICMKTTNNWELRFQTFKCFSYCKCTISNIQCVIHTSNTKKKYTDERFYTINCSQQHSTSIVNVQKKD